MTEYATLYKYTENKINKINTVRVAFEVTFLWVQFKFNNISLLLYENISMIV